MNKPQLWKRVLSARAVIAVFIIVAMVIAALTACQPDPSETQTGTGQDMHQETQQEKRAGQGSPSQAPEVPEDRAKGNEPPANGAPSRWQWKDDELASDWKNGTYTTIALKGASVDIDGSGATAAKGTVTITREGTYVLSGTLSDGQVSSATLIDGRFGTANDGGFLLSSPPF